MMGAVLQLKGLMRTFHQGGRALNVLKSVDLEIKPGEVVGLLGQSGSGKSTLLHIAGLLEKPDAGEVIIDGHNAADLSDRERTRLRRGTIGFVYQFHHLLPEFSALENVVVPQRIARISKSEAEAHAIHMLAEVGLADRLNHRPSQLSGGEQQRVAIARALANGPKLLLADEPTGNLDESTADRVFETLLETVRKTGLSALIATHNPELASRMDRQIHLREGELHEVS